MVLVGQYDSPYVRRVAVSLRVLGFDYDHDTRSVFADFEAMRAINPLARIPSLLLDDGEVLIDSTAILDWLDQAVGPGRALVPPAGAQRQRALRLIALATGAIEKIGAAAYERLMRPPALRWPEWIDRCRVQGRRARRARGRALAGRRHPRSGRDHDRLHDPLRRHGRPRASAAGAPSEPRCPLRALRGAARLSGGVARGLRAAEERARAGVRHFW
jgi:glutathione S-transferase